MHFFFIELFNIVHRKIVFDLKTQSSLHVFQIVFNIAHLAPLNCTYLNGKIGNACSVEQYSLNITQRFRLV